jgi:hypothetical protein
MSAEGRVPSPDGGQQLAVGNGSGSGAQSGPDQGQYGVEMRRLEALTFVDGSERHMANLIGMVALATVALWFIRRQTWVSGGS